MFCTWLTSHDCMPRMHRQACGSDVHLEYNNPDAQWTADCETEHSTAHLQELAHHVESAAPAKNNGDAMSASREGSGQNVKWCMLCDDKRAMRSNAATSGHEGIPCHHGLCKAACLAMLHLLWQQCQQQHRQHIDHAWQHPGAQSAVLSILRLVVEKKKIAHQLCCAACCAACLWACNVCSTVSKGIKHGFLSHQQMQHICHEPIKLCFANAMHRCDC